MGAPGGSTSAGPAPQPPRPLGGGDGQKLVDRAAQRPPRRRQGVRVSAGEDAGFQSARGCRDALDAQVGAARPQAMRPAADVRPIHCRDGPRQRGPLVGQAGSVLFDQGAG